LFLDVQNADFGFCYFATELIVFRFKVSEISQQSADGITFAQELNNGTTKKVTIPQYYAAAYNLKLRFPFLPCIGVKGRDNQTMYFPLEVCNIVSGRRYTKRVSV